MATNREIKEMLLQGAISLKRGRPLRFYDALNLATADQLRSALTTLANPDNRFMYAYQEQRIQAIEARLKEVG